MEGGASAAASAWVFYWFSCGVVVVAELFLAEAWALAAAAVGEDMAALVLFGLFGCVLHGPSPRVLLVQSLRKKRVESGLVVRLVSETFLSSSFRLKAKARLLAGPLLFSIYF